MSNFIRALSFSCAALIITAATGGFDASCADCFAPGFERPRQSAREARMIRAFVKHANAQDKFARAGLRQVQAMPMEAISALSLAQAARLMPAFFLAEDIEAAKFVNSGSITDGGFSYMTVKRQLAQDVLFRKGTLPRLSRQSIYSIFER